MMVKKKIAIVDLSFTWPPDGGARTDVYEVARRLAQKYEVCLFVPHMLGWLKLPGRWVRRPLDRTRFFWRGQIVGDLGFSVQHVTFGPLSFSRFGVGPAFHRAVTNWQADDVWIADGWYLKPYVIQALKDFKPVVRIYAHEMLCLKGNGFFYRWGRACFKNYLSGSWLTSLRCQVCTSAFYLSYPSPTWIHEYLSSLAFLPSYRQHVYEALKYARTLMVYNQFTADRVRTLSQQVHIVPSGVNPELFHRAQASANYGEDHHKVSSEQALSTLSLRNKAEGKKIILVMGRTEEPRKGFSVVLKAAASLAQQRNDFEVWVTDRIKRKQPWLRSVGWVPYQQMPQLYQQVDMAVVPSLWPEPHGIVAVEAMACQVPVIVSAIGGLQDVVVDGVTGFHVPPGDASMMAKRLTELLDDSQLCQRLGQAGQQRVCQHYTWDHIMDQHIFPLFDR